MLSFGLPTQRDAQYQTARRRQFVPLGSQITQTDLLALSVSVDGQDFFCRMGKFLGVHGKRSLEESELCAVQGM
jgi:hypothetical protein